MANKKIVWGMSGVLLAFALTLSGCVSGMENSFGDSSNPKEIKLLSLDSIPAPVRGASPVTSIPANDEYTGVISWQDAAGGSVTAPFGPNTVYKAVVSLTPKSDYTFTGVGTFTYTGATIEQAADGSDLRVTITFPVTGENFQVNLLALDSYIIAPVIGKAPVTAGISNDQYTGAIAWSLEASDASVDTFLLGEAYKAVLTLTAKTGYTFTGLNTPGFTYTGAASVTHTVLAGGSGATVTVIFPATANPEAITDPSAIVGYLAQQPIPAALKLELELSTTNWQAILSALNQANKFVMLDLSACTGSSSANDSGLSGNGMFDPGRTDANQNRNAGKGKIQSLILPDAALSIPNGTSYEQRAFRNFSSLQTVSGKNIVTIGKLAFSGNSLTGHPLTSVDFPLAESIGEQAFSNCKNLTGVSLPEAQTIGAEAFSGCTSLTSASLPVAETIGNGAFSGCTNLTSVSLPATAEIGVGVFRGSKALFTVTGAPGSLSTGDDGKILIQNGELIAYSLFPTAITLPSTVTKIGLSVFNNSTQISSISGSEVLSIADSADSYIDGAFYRCTSLEEVNLPAATSIGNNAFYDCSALEEVNLLAAESIGNNAFYGCTSLATVNLPAAITIGNSAFAGCTSLEEVNLPAATSIGVCAFLSTGAISLTVTFGATPPTVGMDTFSGVASTKNVTVRVPSSGQAAYNSTWRGYFRGAGSGGGGAGNDYISLTVVYI